LLARNAGWGARSALVLSPPRASQIPFRMSTTLTSFQSLGVAPVTLLASAGGMEAVSKRPFLLSGNLLRCVKATDL
jgi:hypothetical protein